MQFLLEVSSLKNEINMIYFLTLCISYMHEAFKPQPDATQKAI